MPGFFDRIMNLMVPDLTQHHVLAAHSPVTPPAAQVPLRPVPKVVGQGGADERIVIIGGLPCLFVKEGANEVVQFAAKFEPTLDESAWGCKVLPALVPHWEMECEHDCSMTEAVSRALRSASGMAAPSRPVRAEPKAETAKVKPDLPKANPTSSSDNPPEADSIQAAAESPPSTKVNMISDKGRIVDWGERKFPSREKKGSYTSFSLCLATDNGEKVLQGEGLKDAISKCGCQVGDVVFVRRLYKEKVLAFDRQGNPKMKDGKQMMYDKWVWSITR